MLLTVPPELLLTIGDAVPDAPLAQCCRALRRLLRHRHLVVNNRPDVLLEPWVLARVSSLRYTCSGVCPVTTILSLGARCPVLETLEITSEGEHIGPAALQPLTNPCLNRFVLRMRRSLLDPGALAALVRVFAQGTLPMLADVVLELQPYGHMDALEMRCLQPLVSPGLGLASVALLLADCTWEGDRLLRHLCPGASPEPSRLRVLQLNLDDTAVSDWGLCNPLSQILRMHPHLHALTLDLNGSELSGGWGLDALMHAVGGATAVRRLDLQLARCDLPDGRAFADLHRLPALERLALNLSDNRDLNGRTAASLAPSAITTLKHLTLEYLRTTMPDVDGALPLLQTLDLKVRHASCPLELPHTLCALVLDVSASPIRLGDPGCQRIAQRLQACTGLRRLVLDVTHQLIQHQGLHSLMCIIAGLPDLTDLSLHMRDNRITPWGVDTLLAALTCPRFTHLCVDLSENPVGLPGAMALVHWAMWHPGCHRLVLQSIHPLTECERCELERAARSVLSQVVL